MAPDHDEQLAHPERAPGGGDDARGIVRRWGRRVAIVDLDGAGRRIELDETVADHARLSGAALALAPFAASAAPVFTLAVGEAVERGVPTAARVTVAARAPLRSGVTEAQCGGPFAFDLAALLDGLVLSGHAAAPVHVVIGGGGVHLRPGTAQTASLSARTREALEHGGSALVVGPAADAGLPFANIASVGGAGAPSFVGRGGLGAALRAAGVLSIGVETRAVRGAADAGQLAAALGRSPRLLERARGGTLELAPHRGAARVERGEGAARHGCRGCPTPCGWVLELEEEGAPRRALGRYAAMHGCAASGEAARCRDRCNELGMDARSAARLVRDLEREAARPGVLDELAAPGRPAFAAALALGP
ncbi:MAG: aldehyde ferredoxin oxidoreductase N-terminal domain-containing protein, partial [Planctomycetota bacterium]|nr:aldehyde ferredoxin oxidoreductase N-terminal domain-containing protein [Planctomycetota bacterium]